MNTLKLNQLSSNEIKTKKANQIRGGKECCCGCLYADKGGSTTEANFSANFAGGLQTPGANCGEVVVIIGTPGGNPTIPPTPPRP